MDDLGRVTGLTDICELTLYAEMHHVSRPHASPCARDLYVGCIGVLAQLIHAGLMRVKTATAWQGRAVSREACQMLRKVLTRAPPLLLSDSLMLARVMPPTPTPPPRRAAADIVENGSELNSARAIHER